MIYIWQLKKFPNFEFQKDKIFPAIQELAMLLGEVSATVGNFPQNIKEDIFSQLMVAEALKTSEIEGEYFSREDIMSSIKMNLGLKTYHYPTRNKKANAIALLMIEVRKSYFSPLTLQMILLWHQILMENEEQINAGQLRKGKEPMQVISGKFGDVKIHYEAPPSQELPELLNNFFIWYKNFNQLNVGKVGQAMILSALSHLYFETLHPFEDGNGRIGRAIAEKVLAEQLEIPIYISLSKIIEANKKKYYSELKKAQRNVDVTDWILYFFDVLIKAQKDSKSLVLFTLKKVIFFNTLKEQLNERQLKAINKMLEHGENGFKGGMTAKKYGSINKISKATATRDLQHLLEIGAFVKIGAGRSIHYDINI